MSNYNNKALNSIIGSLHEYAFTLVTGIDEAKIVTKVFQTRFEGTNDVKQFKLQMILSEFEGLKMREEEKIIDLYSCVQDLMNRASVLGEPFTQSRVIKKVHRFLPKRFRTKVIAIQENAG